MSGAAAGRTGLSPGWRWLFALLLLAAGPAAAHPAPFSYLDIELGDDRWEGMLTVHAIDIAHELAIADPAQALDPRLLERNLPRIGAILGPRMRLSVAGSPVLPEWRAIAPDAPSDAVRLTFRLPGPPPAALSLAPRLFPYDPQHQTFVNIHEGGRLRSQWIFAADGRAKTFYAGTAQGRWAVIETFLPAGVHHILIGPDHLLFLLGLLLMGGSFRTLVGIVTAFTIGHSLTLALAVLGVITLPAWLVEPAIALTIVVVGVDNLLRGEGRDLRAWLALAFGLIHGFGFAGVLQQFGLPQSALGWSLFSFNVGVELGQLMAVVPVALALALIRRRSPAWSRRIASGGSVLVIGAGAFWFVQRLFLMGEG